MDDSAGGNASGSVLREDVIAEPFLLGVFRQARGEPFRLQIEHGAVAAAERDELIVAAQLHDPALLQHTDAVGLSHRGEPVRHQNRGAVAGLWTWTLSTSRPPPCPPR